MSRNVHIKSISVDLEVLTKDRLKKLVFGLDKSPGENDEVQWEINFEFYEREKRSDDFGEALVNLLVGVMSGNFDAAERTALEGLSTPQAEHLLGPVMLDAKRHKLGRINEKKLAATVEKTLGKRTS